MADHQSSDGTTESNDSLSLSDRIKLQLGLAKIVDESPEEGALSDTIPETHSFPVVPLAVAQPQSSISIEAGDSEPTSFAYEAVRLSAEYLGLTEELLGGDTPFSRYKNLVAKMAAKGSMNPEMRHEAALAVLDDTPDEIIASIADHVSMVGKEVATFEGVVDSEAVERLAPLKAQQQAALEESEQLQQQLAHILASIEENKLRVNDAKIALYEGEQESVIRKEMMANAAALIIKEIRGFGTLFTSNTNP